MSPSPDDDQDFGAILAAFEAEQQGGTEAVEPAKAPKVGDRITGRVLDIGMESVFVELGGKSEGVLAIEEVSDDDGNLQVGLGDTVEAMITAVDLGAGVVTLKMRTGGGHVDLTELGQAHAAGIPVEGRVEEVVKGGLSVKIGGARAFCPVSQIDARFVEDPSVWVGEQLSFRITTFEEGRGKRPNIVLSRRVLLEEEARRQAEELRSKLEKGAVVRGVVSSVTSYGAFVDLGGLEGLLHVSEMAHRRIENPEDVVSVGQELEVKILEIEPAKDDRSSERISLSRKALLEDPWSREAGLLAAGSKRQGKVVRLQPFGAFVELMPGVDGLLHVSELAVDRRVTHPREVLEVGAAVDVVVKSVDLEKKRISLILAREGAEPDADEPQEWSDSGSEGFGPMASFFENARKRDG